MLLLIYLHETIQCLTAQCWHEFGWRSHLRSRCHSLEGCRWGDNLTLGRTFLIGHPGLSCCFLSGTKLIGRVVISNYFESPSRGICIWAFCYWHFCKRRTSSHWAPNAVLLDGVQAKLHQYRLQSPPPVRQQREHLYGGPGSDRKGPEILSLQTCCPERLLRLIRHGECVSLAVSPELRCSWGVCLPALFAPILSSLSLVMIFKISLQHASPMQYAVALHPPISQCNILTCQRILVLERMLIIT